MEHAQEQQIEKTMDFPIEKKLKLLMNRSETAEYFDICRLTLAKRIRNGKFPQPIKLGGEEGWTINYINEWFREKERVEIAKQIRKISAVA